MTKKINLTFKRDNLLYDIGNYCYVEGDIMKVDDENRRHQVIDVTQQGNVDRVTRVLDVVYALCVEMLYPYTKVEVSDNSNLVNNLVDSDEYVITMNVPSGFSRTTHELLLKLIHEFMVYNVLHDWLGITDAEAAEKWKYKSDEISGKIRGIVSHRMGRVRIRQHPF